MGWDLFIALLLQLLLAIAEANRAPKTDHLHRMNSRDVGGIDNVTFHQLPPHEDFSSPLVNLPYNPKDPNIDIFVSEGRVNIGMVHVHILWEWIYHAIDKICPYGGENKCTHSYASFDVRAQMDDNVNDSYETTETVDVTVQYMNWGDSKEARHLLINAVAGVLARGSDHEDNCYWFYWWRIRGMDSFHHCNTADTAAVHLPGDYKISVHLKGNSKRGRFECNKIRPAVIDHVEGLHKEIEGVTGTSHGSIRAACFNWSANGNEPITITQGPSDKTSSALMTRDTTNLNGGAIDVFLGKNMVNIGSDAGNVIYDKVYKAIQEICPFGGDNQCLRKIAKFEVWDLKHHWPVRAQIEVNVQYMSWGNNEKVYYLLIGAVAGAFERGSQQGPNCYIFMPKEGNGWTHKYRHCNTNSYIEVHLPNDYKLAVNFAGPSNKGKFDCSIGIQSTHDYVNSLKGEIEAATGESGLETHVSCLNNLVEARDGTKEPTTAIEAPPPYKSPPPGEAPHTENSAIVIDIGSAAINVGSDNGGTLYNQVYQALLNICPFDGPATCSQRTASFEVWAQNGMHSPVPKTITVAVDRSWWAYNKEIHLLLIGSVAGAFERGAYDANNCYTSMEEGGWTKSHRFCNSINFVHVHFPGGPNMVVKFEGGGEVGGEMHCDYVKEPTRKYVQSLQPEIEAATQVKFSRVEVNCVRS